MAVSVAHYGPGNEKMLDSIRNIQQVVQKRYVMLLFSVWYCKILFCACKSDIIILHMLPCPDQPDHPVGPEGTIKLPLAPHIPSPPSLLSSTF